MLLDLAEQTRNVWLDMGGLGQPWLSDHEIVEFCSLQVESRARNKIATLGFIRANFGLFTDLQGRIPWEFTIEGRGVQDTR